MQVDIAATKERIKAKGFTLPGYARANGIDPAKFPAYFFQRVSMPEDVQKILKADNLLVEVADAA